MTARSSDLPARVAGGGLFIGLVAAIGAGALGGSGTKGALLAAAPACPFLTVTGIPCPFCGLTRATLALGSGDIGTALAYHPLVPVILALILWGSWLLARGALPALASRRIALVGVVLLLAFWIAALLAPGG